jgi:hypothetical protein
MGLPGNTTGDTATSVGGVLYETEAPNVIGSPGAVLARKKLYALGQNGTAANTETTGNAQRTGFGLSMADFAFSNFLNSTLAGSEFTVGAGEAGLTSINYLVRGGGPSDTERAIADLYLERGGVEYRIAQGRDSSNNGGSSLELAGHLSCTFFSEEGDIIRLDGRGFRASGNELGLVLQDANISVLVL